MYGLTDNFLILLSADQMCEQRAIESNLRLKVNTFSIGERCKIRAVQDSASLKIHPETCLFIFGSTARIPKHPSSIKLLLRDVDFELDLNASSTCQY